jgi:hypothetical protein
MSQEFGSMRGFSGTLFQGGVPSLIGIIGSIYAVLFTYRPWEAITTINWNDVTAETWN